MSETATKACETCGKPIEGVGLQFGMPTCEACDQATDAADPVSAFGYRQPFSATFDGVRSRFMKVEHFNLGPGWMCSEIDGKLPSGIIGSHMLEDVKDA